MHVNTFYRELASAAYVHCIADASPFGIAGGSGPRGIPSGVYKIVTGHDQLRLGGILRHDLAPLSD